MSTITTNETTFHFHFPSEYTEELLYLENQLQGRKPKTIYKVSKHPKGSEEYKADLREYAKKYRDTHKEQCKIAQVKHKETLNPDHVKEMNKIYNRRRYLKKKDAEAGGETITITKDDIIRIRNSSV